jgi:archaemetzincin
MRRLELLPIGRPDGEMLRELASALADMLPVRVQILPDSLSPEFALHLERRQYHSSQLLYRMQDSVTPETWRLLGVTALDLYIPILTFVFGEAQIGGPCAVVSTHRLRQEFYGLPTDKTLLWDRLLKEAVHELGHTLELTHCDDYRCAMAPSHAVEWIDLKTSTLCSSCQERAAQTLCTI